MTFSSRATGALLLAIGLAAAAPAGAADTRAASGQAPSVDCPGPGPMGRGMGGYGMGPGMMNGDGAGTMGRGPGVGPDAPQPGMMGPGMMNPGMMGRHHGLGLGLQGVRPARDLTVGEVKEILEGRLAWLRNGNLMLGKVEADGEAAAVAEVVTRDGSLVQRLRVDRATGAMQAVE